MIPLILFLLACVAIYLGTIQAAFNALMRVSLRLLAEGSGRAPDLERYLQEPLLLFLPLRTLLGLIEGSIVLLLALMIGVSGPGSLLLLAGSMVAFGAVCEFLIPFLIVSRDPERVLELLLPSFRIISRALNPITYGLLHLLNHSRHERSAPVAVSRDEVNDDGEVITSAAANEPGADTGHEERKLLKSIVDFGDTLVREVMTPRPDIVAIDADGTLDDLRALFREQEYSRIPVFRDNLDNILGFVYVKDLILLGDSLKGDAPITNHLRPAHYVPETKLVSELLREFQQQRIQSAIVVDEYGGTAGLVTLEDLVEEIFGEIRDEYDVEAEPVFDEGNGSFVFSGTADVDEIAERLHVAIEREGFETVGGYLLSHLGHVPAIGEAFDIDGLHVEVIDAERRRVRKVRMTRVMELEPRGVRGEGVMPPFEKPQGVPSAGRSTQSSNEERVARPRE
jgi:CBS domain containing-hemolysin-like protein